ncbi:hypothetical protein [Microvirga roseola]|uniref:hypothetical protein n=1 Tax=Microvirga roseola TaxID=2883126 RepID=UPI001E52838A|nr:hypothetical protein [Microvirga roseola]
MRRYVLPNLDDLDLEARDLAKVAARRAGLSLEDWAARILAGQDGAAETLTTRARRITAEDREALMAAAAAESERRFRERQTEVRMPREASNTRTEIALESMASWMEQTEERLTETARASADHRDRTTEALSQILSAVKDRLDTVEQRTAPARIEFPVQDALKALAPLSETLVGLRSDMSRLAERLEQPGASSPAVEGIRAEIEHLRSSMESLATREEITALDHAVKDLARGLDKGRASKDLLTLASSVAALYRQVQTLSEELAEGMHRRLGGEIEILQRKIDRIAETGVDRSVIDFLSSQIVDMRHDLAQRAEPQQIERLSGEIAALGGQIAELRAHQVGKADFAALKTSLENVCTALGRTVAAQEASDVPEQLQSLSQRLDVLVSRPEPEPANLDPIAMQLALLTERMSELSSSRFDQAEALTEMIGRLSSQVQDVASREAPSQEPLFRRFDQLEEEVRQVGQRMDTSALELMLRNLDEKLDRAPAGTGAPLQKAVDEAATYLKSLQDEASGLAERTARAVLKDIGPSLPHPGDVDALKQGFVELKALQARADKKTQETLRAVHGALETLIARFPDQGVALRLAGAGIHTQPERAPEKLPSADRLEAAVRRLHAAALSQMEEVSASLAAVDATEPRVVSMTSRASPGLESPAAASPQQEAELGNLRASFIAAARRAAQTIIPDRSEPELSAPADTGANLRHEAGRGPADEAALPMPSLLERLRRTLDSHRRPLLLGIALLILAAGTAQVLLAGRHAPSLTAASPDVAPVETANAVGTLPPADGAGLFRAVSLSETASHFALPAQAKFFIDPTTVGVIPEEAPAVLRQAALSGDAAALYAIAAQAAEGRGIPQDMTLALRLFERAAQAGLPPAQERLAMIYDKGAGVPRDAKLAATWYERAAQGGNIRSMHNLATLLASGALGKPDYAAAMRWFGEAAAGGWRDSQFNMGVLLARGAGGVKNLAEAFTWFALAARQGDAEAGKRRDEIAARLSAADLRTAQAALEQWRARTVDPEANDIPVSSPGQTVALDRTGADRS